jgi:hypothetical protein
MSALRVLHGPVNVGNQPYVLSRHERALGADSTLVVNYPTWTDYRTDRSLGAYGVKTPRTIGRRFLFGLTAPFRYDVLHFYFGRSFFSWDDFGGPNWLWFRDLRLARRLGRRVVMTLQGCDVRVSRRSAAQYAFTPCHRRPARGARAHDRSVGRPGVRAQPGARALRPGGGLPAVCER